MKYGTYTTIDTPTKNIEEAYTFLVKEFNKIKSGVLKIQNPHDFGWYPSFEINYPDAIENAKEIIENRELYADDEDEDIPDYILDDWKTEEDAENAQKLIDDWQDKADAIEARYNKKFFN